jgi:lipopolysaccharide transport system permease protein
VTAAAPVLELDSSPASAREVVSDLWRHRDVLRELSWTDFQVRYKRAVFGVLWAVVVPLLQAVVVGVVFSHVVRDVSGSSYALYVLSGVLPWSYFATTLAIGAGAIVDGAELSEKLWFPRAMLPMVPAIAGLVGLGICMVVLVIAVPVLHAGFGISILLLPVACLQLVAFTTALSLVLAALHVYFRDVRYLVQALLLVWFYATPLLYPASLLDGLAPWLDANPMTGVIALFRDSLVGSDASGLRSILVSAGTTVVLLAVAVEVYRRHDRLFADRL